MISLTVGPLCKWNGVVIAKLRIQNDCKIMKDRICMLIWPTDILSKFVQMWTLSGGSRGGRNRRAPPLNFDRLFFCIPLCIKMLQRLTWEHQNPPRVSRALKRALDPGQKVLRASRSLCVCAHTSFAPPLNENPGSAPDASPNYGQLKTQIYGNDLWT